MTQPLHYIGGGNLCGENPRNQPVAIGHMTVEITDPVTGETRTVTGFAARGRTVTPEILERLRIISSGSIVMLDATGAPMTDQPLTDQSRTDQPLPMEPLPTTNQQETTDYDLTFRALGRPLGDGYQPEPGERALDIISIVGAVCLLALLAYLLIN